MVAKTFSEEWWRLQGLRNETVNKDTGWPEDIGGGGIGAGHDPATSYNKDDALLAGADLYAANADIPEGTLFEVGVTGATWRSIGSGGARTPAGTINVGYSDVIKNSNDFNEGMKWNVCAYDRTDKDDTWGDGNWDSHEPLAGSRAQGPYASSKVDRYTTYTFRDHNTYFYGTEVSNHTHAAEFWLNSSVQTSATQWAYVRVPMIMRIY